jgi:hypothetical protein
VVWEAVCSAYGLIALEPVPKSAAKLAEAEAIASKVSGAAAKDFNLIAIIFAQNAN